MGQNIAIIQNTADHKLSQTIGVHWSQIDLLQAALMLG